MYRIDRDNNRVQKLTQRTFTDLGFEERRHLQEWIAANPDALGEDLLIIQKEFAGFDDTSERLDLLALDRHGNLVIIENKLDDSGRDVTWQALKYASYCSSLTKEHVREIFGDYLRKERTTESAEAKLVEFFEGTDYDELEINTGLTQRVILVASRFRKEVTSTVLWLLNFRLRIHCFKVTPFVLNEDILLNFEQIIPVPDAEAFMVGMATKTRGELDTQVKLQTRHKVRLQFWQKALEVVSSRSDLYQNVSPRKEAWISAGSGIGGVQFTMGATASYCRAELYIGRTDADENRFIFDRLQEQREALEAPFGAPLVWEPLEDSKACRVKAEREANIYDEDEWPDMIDFLADRIVRLDRAFRGPLSEIGRELRRR